jgi:hypothetical protein
MLAAYLANLTAMDSLIRAANGGCIGSGLSKARWEICWMKIFRLVEKNALYRFSDKVLKHKDELFGHLRQRWAGSFRPSFLSYSTI